MHSQTLSGLQIVAPVSIPPIDNGSTETKFQYAEPAGFNDILDAIYTKVLGQILPNQITTTSFSAPDATLSIQINDVAQELPYSSFALYLKNYDQGATSPLLDKKQAIDLKRRYQALYKSFYSEQRFMQFILNSVRRVAHSLAFFQVFRITHNQFNAHALLLNGHIVNNNEIDFEQISPIQQTARDLFSRSLCYFNSFNKTNLSNTALLEFFDDTFLEHKTRLNVTLLGLDDNDFNSPLFTDLLRDASLEIEECYCSIRIHASSTEDRLFHFMIDKFCETEPLSASSTLLHQAHSISQSHLLLASHFLNAGIKSLRRVCFSKALGQTNVRTLVKNRLSRPSNHSIANEIEQYEATSAWIFDRNDTHVHTIIFSNPTLQCYYVPITSSFVIEHFVKGHKYVFLTVKELLIYLKNQAKTDFNLPGFLGWEALFMLLQALLQIEFSWQRAN